MIGIDTNVLIRYLVQDDPAQSKLANKFIESCVASGDILWICQMTLCETFWVLERCYKLEKHEIIRILKEILLVQQIQVEEDTVVWHALRDFENTTKVGFVDCLIGRQNAFHECSYTYTFDKSAAKELATFKMLLA